MRTQRSRLLRKGGTMPMLLLWLLQPLQRAVAGEVQRECTPPTHPLLRRCPPLPCAPPVGALLQLLQAAAGAGVAGRPQRRRAPPWASWRAPCRPTCTPAQGRLRARQCPRASATPCPQPTPRPLTPPPRAPAHLAAAAARSAPPTPMPIFEVQPGPAHPTGLSERLGRACEHTPRPPELFLFPTSLTGTIFFVDYGLNTKDRRLTPSLSLPPTSLPSPLFTAVLAAD